MMKRPIASYTEAGLAVWLGFAFAMSAPAAPADDGGPVAGQPARFAISGPVRSMGADTNVVSKAQTLAREIPMGRVRRPAGPVATLKSSLDPAVQRSFGPLAMPAPLMTFEGLGNDAGVLPPDPNGDVGPSNYVEAVNLRFRVYDRQGTPLTSALTISSLFAAIGGPAATQDNGDPLALYDPLADRWIITQFVVDNVVTCHQAIAISQTGDPMGSYYLYDFLMPNTKMNDYPKFGVWPDAYYMTDNQFSNNEQDWAGAGVFAFDRKKMLAGDPTAGYVYFDLYAVDTGIAGMLPADVDGPPPPAGTPGYFAYPIATKWGDPTNGLRVYEFRADFANPPASTFTQVAQLASAPFDPDLGSTRSQIPQPGTSVMLDGISDRLMYRLQYRNFGSYETLVANHTVDENSANHAGVRFYELRRALPGGALGIYQQGTYAPDSDHRWMASAAMDWLGNLAIGYSVSGSGTYPSIRYAGRLATDPTNFLSQGEATLQAGNGSQTSATSRWGDYTMLAIDPVDDCTFWYVNEYYSATSSSSWRTRVGTFRFTNSTPAPRGSIAGTVRDADTGAAIAGAAVLTSNGYYRTTDASGRYQMAVSTGRYAMAASAPGYLASTSAVAVVTNGGAASIDFALSLGPALSFSAPEYVASETGGTAVITVVRPVGTALVCSVSFSTSNGTATAGVDYVATNGALIFAAGVLSRSFNITILNNSFTTGVHTVGLFLGNLSANAVLGSPGQATLLIVDDEDKTAPGLASAFAEDADMVYLVFSEAMDSRSAQTATNYAVSRGVSADLATLRADRRTLALSVATLTGGVYAVAVSNVQDMAGNRIASGTTTNVRYPDPNLQMWLPLDDMAGTTASDATGNGHAGTLVNGPVWSAGRMGGALSFDEVNDYVGVSTFAYGPEFTLSFWFRTADNTGTTFQYMFSHGSPQQNNNLNVYVCEDQSAYPGILRTSCLDSDDSTANEALFALDVPLQGFPDDVWHLYTLTLKGGEGAQVYLDGRLRAASAALGGSAFSPATSIFIGGRSDLNADRFYGGLLDDVRLYNRAVRSNEVAYLFNRKPAASIATPRPGSEFVQRESVTFSGSGTDPDGTIAYLGWRSGTDGFLGSGASLTNSTLSPALQTVTLSAYDDLGARGATAIAIRVWADAQTNGLPDAWEAGYWPAGNSGGATNDFDHDGLSNFQEWLAGTSPTNAASRFEIVDFRSVPPTNSFALTWPSISNRLYDVESSTNLLKGFVPLATGLPPTPADNTYTDAAPIASSNLFYRVKVTR